MRNPRARLWTAVIALLLVVALYGGYRFASQSYTTLQIDRARSHGFSSTAEEAARRLLEDGYIGIRRIDVLYAGPNSPDGKNPHVWYVVAEVRAESRSDGSEPGRNGCDAPGTFVLQAREGWFVVPEGAFPGLLGNWMREFGLAGPGAPVASIDTFAGRPTQMCRFP